MLNVSSHFKHWKLSPTYSVSKQILQIKISMELDEQIEHFLFSQN